LKNLHFILKEFYYDAREFLLFFTGLFELTKSEKLTKEQVQEIKNHLNLVLNKVTPVVGSVTTTSPIAYCKNIVVGTG